MPYPTKHYATAPKKCVFFSTVAYSVDIASGRLFDFVGYFPVFLQIAIFVKNHNQVVAAESHECVEHTALVLLIGGDIEAGLRGIDIVRVELLAHRLVDILLCIVDVELGAHLIRLVLVQLLLIAGDIRVVLRLGLTVLDHVLFVLLLCAGAGDFLAVGDGLISIPFTTLKPPNSTAQITAAAAICLYLWATAKNSETRSISCS